MEFWIALGIVFFALLFVGMSLPLRDEQEQDPSQTIYDEG